MKFYKLLFTTGCFACLNVAPVCAIQSDSTQSIRELPLKTASTCKIDTLVVNARLVEIFSSFPNNDLYNYVYIMKYRIISVIKGTYKEQKILVGHYNPKIARNQIKDKMDPIVDGDASAFTIGEKHKMVLITPIESVWKDAVEDNYEDSDAPKFFALRCDKIK